MSDLSWPDFLDLLDSEPQRAFDQFYRYAYRELTDMPPRPMRALSIENQQDLLEDIILHCVNNDFRILRQYRNVGKSFACWLYKIAHNKALKYLIILKKKWPAPPEPENPGDKDLIEKLTYHIENQQEKRYEFKEILSKVRESIKKIDNRCRLLLEMASDEYTPREMVMVLGLPKDKNVKVSNDLRYCRKKLEDLLYVRGVIIEDYF